MTSGLRRCGSSHARRSRRPDRGSQRQLDCSARSGWPSWVLGRFVEARSSRRSADASRLPRPRSTVRDGRSSADGGAAVSRRHGIDSMAPSSSAPITRSRPLVDQQHHERGRRRSPVAWRWSSSWASRGGETSGPRTSSARSPVAGPASSARCGLGHARGAYQGWRWQPRPQRRLRSSSRGREGGRTALARAVGGGSGGSWLCAPAGRDCGTR